MRSLPDNNEAPKWRSSIIDDLSFIKNHLRYPFNGRTMSWAIVLGLLIALVSRLGLAGIMLSNKTHRQNWIEPVLISLLLIFSLSFTIYTYLQSLRFISIPTRFLVYENQQLLKKFLESQHLLIYRHPEAPEVFQITSRSIHPKDDDKEVMVFIADDKRILINSHFTNAGFRLTPQSRNYKEMASRLRQWLEMHDLHIDNTNTTVHKSA